MIKESFVILIFWDNVLLTFFTHRTLVTILSVTLMAFLTYQLALLIWRHDDSSFQAYIPKPVQNQPVSQKNTILSNGQLVRQIINSKPFGDARVQKKVEPVQKETISAPETELNYKLRGVYYSDNELLSSAIIEINNKNVESYAVKDEIESGIVVHAIEVKRIVLDRYGKFETLSLEEIKFDKNNKALSIVAKPDTNPAHSQLLQSYRKRFVNNPMALARKFRSIPVMENGKNIGFKLKAVRGETLLKKLNVPEEAIFTSINGVGLDKPFQALEALKSLQTAKSISVTYLLNGVEQSRDFNL